MEFIEQKVGSAIILELSGRLDATNSGDLESKLFKLIDVDEKNIILDCSRLDYISSSGLRVCLVALKKVSGLKGNFILCSMNDNIKQIFDISGFSNIFKILNDKEEALNSIE